MSWRNGTGSIGCTLKFSDALKNARLGPISGKQDIRSFRMLDNRYPDCPNLCRKNRTDEFGEGTELQNPSFKFHVSGWTSQAVTDTLEGYAAALTLLPHLKMIPPHAGSLRKSFHTKIGRSYRWRDSLLRTAKWMRIHIGGITWPRSQKVISPQYEVAGCFID